MIVQGEVKDRMKTDPYGLLHGFGFPRKHENVRESNLGLRSHQLWRPPRCYAVLPPCHHVALGIVACILVLLNKASSSLPGATRHPSGRDN